MKNNNINEFLAQQKIAVVGASNDRTKYGNTVFRRLKKLGYDVFPVNPNASDVEGDKCYPTLHELPAGVDGIVCVVPPKVTEEVVQEATKEGIKHIWMQPGAESEKAVRYCSEQGIDSISRRCILVETN